MGKSTIEPEFAAKGIDLDVPEEKVEPTSQPVDKVEKPEKPDSRIVVNRKTPRVVKETQSTEETSKLKTGSSVAELQNQAVNFILQWCVDCEIMVNNVLRVV